MSGMNDWNDWNKSVKSGQQYVNPLAYLPGEDDDSIYVFASKDGAPTHPDWYHNLVAAGEATIEVGSVTYPVTISGR